MTSTIIGTPTAMNSSPNKNKINLRISTSNVNDSPPIDLTNLPTIQVSSPTSPTDILPQDYLNRNKEKENEMTKGSSTSSTSSSNSSGNNGINEEGEGEGKRNNKSEAPKLKEKFVNKEDKTITGNKNNNYISTTTKESNSNSTSSNSPTSPSMFSFLPSLNFDSLPSISLPSPPSFSLPSFSLGSLLPKLNAGNISFLPGGSEDEEPSKRKRRGRARVGEIIGAGVGEEERGIYDLGVGGSTTREVKSKRSNRDRYSMDLRMEQATANGETFEDVSHDSISNESWTSPATPPITSPSTSSFPSLLPLTKPPTLTSSPSTHSIPSSAAFTAATKATPVNPLTLQSIARKNSETDALKLIREREEREKKWRSEETLSKNSIGRPGLMTRMSSSNMTSSKSSNTITRVESPQEILIGGQEEEEVIVRSRETGQRRNFSEDTIVPSSGRSVSNTAQSTSELISIPVASTSSTKPLESPTSSLSKVALPGASQIKRKLSLLSRFGRGRTSSSGGNASVIIEEPKVIDAPTLLPKSEKAVVGTRIDKGKEKEKVRYIKVKSKNKVTKDFGKLFLAQELFISPPTPSTSKVSSPQREDSESLHSTHSVHDGASQHSNYTEDTHQTTASPGKTKNAIWSIKFSTDGKYLATGGKDGIVRVWEVLSTAEARETASSPDAASPNSTRIPVASMPIFKTKPLHEFTGHENDVLDLSWSKNNFLLSSSMDKTVRLWHVSRTDCLCAFQHLDFVTSIAFHPKDDRFFLSGSLDCKLRLWNIPEKRVHVWTELPDLITSVAFTSDGKLAAAGNFVGVVMMFEVETFRYHSQFASKSTRGKNSKGKKITSMVPFPLASSIGELFLVTSNDSRMRVFQVSDKSLQAKYAGHENTSSQIRANFSDDGKFIISGSEDRNVYIWDSGLLTKDVGNWSLRKKNQEAGYESFHLSANVITCANFAPTTTRDILSSSSDPIFSSQNAFLATSIPASRTTTQESSTPISGSEDCIIVTADDSSGIISVFRNSTFVVGEEVSTKKNRRQSRVLSESSNK